MDMLFTKSVILDFMDKKTISDQSNQNIMIKSKASILSLYQTFYLNTNFLFAFIYVNKVYLNKKKRVIPQEKNLIELSGLLITQNEEVLLPDNQNELL